MHEQNTQTIDINEQRSIQEWIKFFEQQPVDVVIKIYNHNTKATIVLTVEQGCE